MIVVRRFFFRSPIFVRMDGPNESKQCRKWAKKLNERKKMQLRIPNNIHFVCKKCNAHTHTPVWLREAIDGRRADGRSMIVSILSEINIFFLHCWKLIGIWQPIIGRSFTAHRTHRRDFANFFLLVYLYCFLLAPCPSINCPPTTAVHVVNF